MYNGILKEVRTYVTDVTTDVTFLIKKAILSLIIKNLCV